MERQRWKDRKTNGNRNKMNRYTEKKRQKNRQGQEEAEK